MEELFLESFLAFDELDVVDEKNVDLAVGALELNGRVLTNCIDKVVEEGLGGGHITNREVRVVRVYVAFDRTKEVGFAKTSVTVDKERVV